MFRRAPGIAIAAALLSVLVAAPSAHAAVVTGHTGSGAPGLAEVGNRLYVAWTGSSGTAAAKQVILGYSTNGGKNVVKVGENERTPQGEGVALVADPDAPGVFMAWADARNGNTLTIVRYDTAGFTCRTAFPGFVSPHAPALGLDSSGKLYLAWTDPARHLHAALIIPDACAMTVLHPAVLAETSPFGPSLAYFNGGLRLSWIGDDPARTVNLAAWGGNVTLYDRTTVPSPARPASAPSLRVDQGNLYTMFRAEDGYAYYSAFSLFAPAPPPAANTGTRLTSPVGQAATGLHFGYFNPAGNLVIDG